MKWPSHHVNVKWDQKVIPVRNLSRCEFSHVNTPFTALKVPVTARPFWIFLFPVTSTSLWLSSWARINVNTRKESSMGTCPMCFYRMFNWRQLKINRRLSFLYKTFHDGKRSVKTVLYWRSTIHFWQLENVLKTFQVSQKVIFYKVFWIFICYSLG